MVPNPAVGRAADCLTVRTVHFPCCVGPGGHLQWQPAGVPAQFPAYRGIQDRQGLEKLPKLPRRRLPIAVGGVRGLSEAAMACGCCGAISRLV